MSTPLVRNIVTSHADPGWNYGYARSPFFQFSHALGASYLVYSRRLMPISFADADRTAGYWDFRRNAGLFDTGELPTEISGPDAERLCDKVFTRDITRLRPGRCGYNIACYPDGGDVYSWLIAQGADMNVVISNPGSWVSQVQGPRSMDILAAALDDGAPDDFRYFDVREATIGDQRVFV
ncbi:MAG: hypothetical protein VCB77_02630 [Alphaproteobacteria bacterium]